MGSRRQIAQLGKNKNAGEINASSPTRLTHTMSTAASLVQFNRANYAPQLPTKHIFNQNDVDRFVKTAAYARLITFIDLFNQSVLGKKISDPCPMSPVS